MPSNSGFFVARDWIGIGKSFDTAPDFVQQAFRDCLAIPSSLHSILLPARSCPVSTLISTSLPHAAEHSPSNLNFYFAPTPSNPQLGALRTRPIPPSGIVDSLLAIAGDQWMQGNNAICYAHLESDGVPIPLWVLSFWAGVHHLRQDVLYWSAANQWVSNRRIGDPTAPLRIAAEHAAILFHHLQWANELHSFEGRPAVRELTTFLSRNWLHSTHLCLMLELLQHDLESTAAGHGDSVRNTFFSQKLESCYRACCAQTMAPTQLPSWINDVGNKLSSGSQSALGLVFNINNVHWVAVVVDFVNRRILYSDPKGDPPPQNILATLTWWASFYNSDLPAADFVLDTLPCTLQGPDDHYSCGLLAVNSLQHYFLPQKYPLIPISDVDLARMHTMMAIVHAEEDDVISYQSLLGNSSSLDAASPETTLPSSPPLDTTSSENNETTPSSIPHLKRLRPSENVSTENCDTTPPSSSTPDIATDADATWDRIFAQTMAPRKRVKKAKKDKLTQNPKPKPKLTKVPGPSSLSCFESLLPKTQRDHDLDSDSNSDSEEYDTKVKTGRPRDAVIEQLICQAPRKKGQKQRRHQCVGPGCEWSLAGRAAPRVLEHSTRCRYLPPHLKALACQTSQSLLLGAKLEKLNQAAAAMGPEPTTVVPTVPRYHRRKQLKLRLDHAILKFLCVHGIAPHVVDSLEWKEIYEIANSRYHPVSSTTLADAQIPQEAEYVRSIQVKYLCTKINLTISYDGGALRSRQPFYTVHVSTAEREIFFVKGHPGKGESHTAEWIKKLLLEVIDSIGRTRFSGVTSDSTGNTKACRRLLCAMIPTIINLPDPVHHTALTIKDICQLEFFSPIIAELRKCLTFFSHSDDATNKLAKVRGLLGIGRGLERIGKTRFATIVHAAVAMRRCLPALREACTNHELDLDSQFRAYAAGYYPFSVPLADNETVLQWWQNLEKTSHADILACQILAVKLFSVVPNSMAANVLRQRLHSDSTVLSHRIKGPLAFEPLANRSILRYRHAHAQRVAPRVKAVEPVDDDDMDSDDEGAWLDDKPTKFTRSESFTLGSDVNLQDTRLLELLASDVASGDKSESIEHAIQDLQDIGENGGKDDTDWGEWDFSV
ncbi:hypothetical protein A0H81_04594 [Grifola frondosa]|uniref:Ubiquitin-like protease family profile domain-containing protein n=1 Tax=Grifola frondosa TaxID=5627 RepID=A0A1C7MK47_GRIFR|nr:hypothetical protein A0H81_04594 [Grifola frondosa]